MKKDRQKKINAEARKIRRKLCKEMGIAETGKPLKSKIVERDIDGRPKVFGVAIGKKK